jgi:hypothetical protein
MLCSAMLSDAVALSVVVPPTVAPFDGTVNETEGAVISGPAAVVKVLSVEVEVIPTVSADTTA